jgi:hypothetical protein
MKCRLCREEIKGDGLIGEFGITHFVCSFEAYLRKYKKKLDWSLIIG